MATLQGMSGMDLAAMVQELRALLPLWIGKIYQFDGKTLGIRLNGEGARHQLLVEAGRRAHLTPAFPAPPKIPPGFAMLLRKHLYGGRIPEIGQVGMERVFYIAVQKRDACYRLYLELFDEGNAILCTEDDTIIKPLWHHRFRERDVVPGSTYALEGIDCTQRSPTEFEGLLRQSGRDLVRTLAVDCMLGGPYAEEVCRRAGAEKTAPAAEADAGAVFSALTSLVRDVKQDRRPVIMESGCWPIPLGRGAVLQTFDTFNQALAAYYPAAPAAKPEASPRLTREEVIRRQQEASVARFEQRIRRLERVTELIYENYPRIQEVLSALSDARKTRSWQEIESLLKKSDTPLARRVVAVHPAENAVEVDIGVSVKLPLHQSIEETVGSYYDQIKRLRRKREGALAAMDRALPERQKLERRGALTPAKPRWFHRFRWFYTSDGVLVLGGKNAEQNEELVKKYMEGGDTFVHADVHGASVVIVKGRTERMDEAAQFAASFSGAWKAGHFVADVYSARPDQISKTPPSGEYVTRGSFIVRGERTYYRDVPLAVSIGVQLTPEAAVIGGPPSAVSAHADIRVQLAPGPFGENDTAKKVVRLLRQKIPPEYERAMRGILSTERVMAFVPPGGSEIAGDHEE